MNHETLSILLVCMIAFGTAFTVTGGVTGQATVFGSGGSVKFYSGKGLITKSYRKGDTLVIASRGLLYPSARSEHAVPFQSGMTLDQLNRRLRSLPDAKYAGPIEFSKEDLASHGVRIEDGYLQLGPHYRGSFLVDIPLHGTQVTIRQAVFS